MRGARQHNICIIIDGDKAEGHPTSFLFRVRYWLLAMRHEQAVVPALGSWFNFWRLCPEYKVADIIFRLGRRWPRFSRLLAQ